MIEEAEISFKYKDDEDLIELDEDLEE